MSRLAIIAACAAGAVLAVVACTQPRGSSTGTRADAGHWVHGAELQEIMMDLQTAAEREWPVSDINASVSDDAREEALDQACRLASALQVSAGRIPQVARDAGVREDELQRFIAEASKLQDQARRLEHAGLQGDVDGMQLILDDISATCDSCHVKFRDIAGPLAQRG